ncbi:MAG: NifB/NifX family molybdenum-iron cluster-binding protein [Desulfuromonadaceae bacterium]|nr:NifB/NifX family molybdenum-iron cluster-binding protein [Desulfuromonadaceae bacterium]
MKVAFTTSNGAVIDENFRKASSYSVWDIGPEESYYVTTVFIREDAVNEDDKINARVEALKECAIVCAKEINGPAAAKLVSRHIHPMKTGSRVAVGTIIDQLQDVLRSSSAPWICKAHYTENFLEECIQ